MKKYLVRKIGTRIILANQGGGACSVFAGRVRADKVKGKTVKMIEYSSYNGLAERVMAKIEKETMKKFKLKNLMLKHRTGAVKAGEVVIVVSAEGRHRRQTIDAMGEAVERIKKEVPIWKKEIFEDGSYRWI